MTDDNTDNTLKSNVGLYNYFDADRISSGDIGIQNRNSGGGYGSSIYGGDGADGKDGSVEVSRRLIPMVALGADNRVKCASIPAINHRKNDNRQPNEKKVEQYRNMIETIDSDDINRIGYIERERFINLGSLLNDESVKKLIKIIVILIGLYVILHYIYGKTHYWNRPTWTSNTLG